MKYIESSNCEIFTSLVSTKNGNITTFTNNNEKLYIMFKKNKYIWSYKMNYFSIYLSIMNMEPVCKGLGVSDTYGVAKLTDFTEIYLYNSKAMRDKGEPEYIKYVGKSNTLNLVTYLESLNYQPYYRFIVEPYMYNDKILFHIKLLEIFHPDANIKSPFIVQALEYNNINNLVI